MIRCIVLEGHAGAVAPVLKWIKRSIALKVLEKILDIFSKFY